MADSTSFVKDHPISAAPAGSACPLSTPPPSAMDCTHPEILLIARELSLTLQQRCILDRISFSLASHTITTIIGPNGGGKTTLVKLLLGLIDGFEGELWKRPGLRIGYVPQTWPVSTMLPLSVRGLLRLCIADDVKPSMLDYWSEQLGILPWLDRPLYTLSEGAKQRVLLVRALVRYPHLLVLDEPMQGVDLAGQLSFYQLLTTLRDTHHMSIIMVSHDLHVVMQQTDHVLCVNHHLCCAGTPESIAAHPVFRHVFGQDVCHHLGIYRHTHDHVHHGTDWEGSTKE